MPPPDITERTEMNGMQLSRNTHIPICDNSKKPTIKREGELYKLFHSVNTLAAVLNAHAENELRSKEFLRDTISDISATIVKSQL